LSSNSDKTIFTKTISVTYVVEVIDEGGEMRNEHKMCLLDDTNLGGNQATITGVTMVKAIWRRRKIFRATVKGNTGRKLWRNYFIITTCTTM